MTAGREAAPDMPAREDNRGHGGRKCGHGGQVSGDKADGRGMQSGGPGQQEHMEEGAAAAGSMVNGNATRLLLQEGT